ncbi:MAG: hypothetical protein EB120_06195, partial [Proteobacteria bacterium]|nr:hypothetical protein [Pseudomonadota bacterium]
MIGGPGFSRGPILKEDPMEPIKLKEAELDGKKIAYSNQSLFEVQVGYKKSAYKTKYSFTGELGRAVFFFNAINIGNGYKKRLVCFSMNKP